MKKLFLIFLLIAVFCISLAFSSSIKETKRVLSQELTDERDTSIASFEKTNKLAEHGDAQAQYNLGMMYLYGEDTKETDKLLKQVAEQGLIGTFAAPGDKLYTLEKPKKDYTAALYWLTKSAKQGNADAQLILGRMYVNGEGINQNYKEAVKWFRKAAEQGNVDAQYSLALMYSLGTGVKRNRMEEFYWCRKAAEQNHKKAQAMLGLIYSENQDYQEATKWFEKAAEQGDADAQHDLGMMNFRGKGIKQNNQEAAK
ncbi:MAG: sel1 repeat family protein [Endomicrobia bacterium]|nr:sel1 repeat family protein [Endomicrobiia bacterium]MCL2799413.1 sel1 repeat family protein [Endomicrobiia bacterium]